MSRHITAADQSGRAIDPGTSIRAARRLNRAAGMLAASVLADSAVEHYRGSFHNRAMVTPLVSAALSLAVSLHGTMDKKPAARRFRDCVYVGAGLTGIAGTLFHIFNIGKKPGGFSWQNLFYSAPVGAPAALSLSGVLGYLSERVRETPAGSTPRILGLPAGRVIAGTTAVGLLGTVGEAGLLHFRGAYHSPFMLLPVTMPPIAAGLMANAALRSAPARHPVIARAFLRLTAALGIVGAGFHARGVARNMGGWRNWTQNLLNGPPIPAPPSFTGLALAGLAALALVEDHPDA